MNYEGGWEREQNTLVTWVGSSSTRRVTHHSLLQYQESTIPARDRHSGWKSLQRVPGLGRTTLRLHSSTFPAVGALYTQLGFY